MNRFPFASFEAPTVDTLSKEIETGRMPYQRFIYGVEG